MTTEQEQNLADAEITLIKIGFIGAGGTGKTSVARILHHLPEPFRPSIVRATMAAHGVTSEADQLGMSEEERWCLQRALIQAKRAQDEEFTYGLFDRTPIDHMGYIMHRCANVIPDKEFEELWALYTDLTSRYDLLVYFPVYDWGVNHEDGFRQGNRSYRVKQHLLMHSIALEMGFGLQLVEMANISPEARAEFLMPRIEEAREAKRERERLRTALSYEGGPLR